MNIFVRVESIPLVFEDVVVLPSSSIRNLGVVLDRHLSMKAHVGEACRKAYYQLWRFGKIRKYLDMVSCNTLICFLVFPHLDFGLPDYLIIKLQRVQNFAARIVAKANRFASTQSLLIRLH